jgi:hypothetical protein
MKRVCWKAVGMLDGMQVCLIYGESDNYHYSVLWSGWFNIYGIFLQGKNGNDFNSGGCHV